MAAIEVCNVTREFATTDGGTFTALQEISLTESTDRQTSLS